MARLGLAGLLSAVVLAGCAMFGAEITVDARNDSDHDMIVQVVDANGAPHGPAHRLYPLEERSRRAGATRRSLGRHRQRRPRRRKRAGGGADGPAAGDAGLARAGRSGGRAIRGLGAAWILSAPGTGATIDARAATGRRTFEEAPR